MWPIPRFCVEGLPKILDVGYFVPVLILWQSDKKQTVLKQSRKDFIILAEVPIFGSDNIFNIVVNGAFLESI